MDFSTLNQQQHAAVVRHEGPMMILAGAGTGKTRVISYRIGHMLEVGGIRAAQMVALTFTNKAAREMKERIFDLAGSLAKGIFVGTFHSFCISILRRHAVDAGLHTHFKLIGTSEQIDLIRRSIDELKWGQLYKPEMVLSRISNAKNALVTPEDLRVGQLPMDFRDDDPAVLAEVYAMYERQLKLNRVIDFDDCILKVVKTLEGCPGVLASLQDRYTHFMVDEFQDTNRAQLRVMELLARRTCNICVVGDDDQSIYSWRGAMVETLDRFEDAFPGTVLIKLEQNYRCSNVILDAANAVIAHNTGRKGKTLWSTSTIEHPILVASLDDDQEEAKWIAKRCFGLLGQGYRPRDIGILYRANAQARALEVALREYNLKYKVFGGSSFFERKEVKDFLSYFKLALDPDDRLSFWRVINTPSRGIGIKTLEKIEQKSLELHISPFQVFKDKLIGLNGPVEEAVGQFIASLDDLRRRGPTTPEDVEVMGRDIIRSFKLEDDIRLKTSHEGARIRKMESLRRLPAWLQQLTQNQFDEKESLDIHGLLDHLTLSGDDAGEKDKGDGNHISLMTIHAAKGLEFPCVFVCGIEEEQLPHKNSLESIIGLAEERRLFYVALTRAKEQLFLSLARERFSGFQKLLRKPSRFMKELPEKGVLQEGINAALRFETVEDRKTKNVARLQSLKDSMKKGFLSP